MVFLSEQLSERIAVARFVLIVSIVVVHVPPYEPLYWLELTPFALIKAFFTHGLFKASVPLLTVISGYLLYRSAHWKRPVSLLRAKSRSLLVPLILWNLPLALMVFAIQRYQLLPLDFSLYLADLSVVSWLNATVGLFNLPINPPLHFLRDLFVLACCSPLLAWMVGKDCRVAVVIVSVIYYFNLDGPIILRNFMMMCFVAGMLLAHLNADLRVFDRWAWLSLLVLIAISAYVVIEKSPSPDWFRFVSPLLVWPVISLLNRGRLARWLISMSDHSFAIFLMHAPILFVAWQCYQRFGAGLPYWLFWLLTPALTLLMVIIFNTALGSRLPQVHKVIMGGR